MEIPNYFFVIQASGFLFLLDLASYAPVFKLYFSDSYQPPGIWNAPAMRALLFCGWLLASMALLLAPEAALLRFGSLLFFFFAFRLYYIRGRWLNLFRGGGAVGFMPHFVVAYFLLFEVAGLFADAALLREELFLLFRFDLGFVLLCAGVYKALAGYWQAEGMEYSLSNPIWCYHYRILRRVPPQHLVLRVQNVMATGTEIAAGISLMIPQFVGVGGLLCILIFLYLTPLLRLGRLPFLMAAIGLLFLPDFGGGALSRHSLPVLVPSMSWLPPLLHAVVVCAIVVLVLIKVMQYLNLFLNRSYPEPAQSMFERFANAVPIIIWRVFTADIIDFFIRIYFVDQQGKQTAYVDEESTYRYWGGGRLLHKLRYLHVMESITLAALFNSLKYFTSDESIFRDKLLRYTRTLPVPAGSDVRFEYVKIVKADDEFRYLPIASFLVHCKEGEVIETLLAEQPLHRQPSPYGPVRESRGVGSYRKKEG